MVPVLVGMSRRCFVGLITRARCSVRCCAVIVLEVRLCLIFTRARCSVRCYAVIMLGVGLRPTIRNSLPYASACSAILISQLTTYRYSPLRLFLLSWLVRYVF